MREQGGSYFIFGDCENATVSAKGGFTKIRRAEGSIILSVEAYCAG